MKYFLIQIAILTFTTTFLPAQTSAVVDDFEGNGTITSWFGDNCNINTRLNNPFKLGINTSTKVLEYHDIGGQYANVRFDIASNFELLENNIFTLKIYVPSSGLTGSQPNQVSLKLQDATLSEPWSTQSEIIKPLTLNQWQTVTFDFGKDNYVNLNANSLPPTKRKDFNRVLIQLNGENNNNRVLAYLDDFSYNGTITKDTDPIFDNLVWSDEFEVDGAINSNKWFHQTKLPQNGSWFNGEIQHYTNKIDNSFVSNKVLRIVAKKETFTDQGVTKQYTSARLNSKFAFKYGRVEIRAKLPTGIGTWPALWMLGKNITENGGYWNTQGFGTSSWPFCGEIDIMEHWGNNQNFVQSATHTPSSSGATVNLGGQNISTASTAFHTYTLVWTPKKLVFSVDGITHFTYNPPVKNANTWPFDADQYLLLNVALLPEISPSFTNGTMEIDYVRVYQEKSLSISETQEDFLSKVYPVPFTNHLKINLNNVADQTTLLKIYGNNGNLITSYNAEIYNNSIELNNLSSLTGGLYFFNFTINNKPYTIKVIKNF